jgi:hypothetical protein
MIGSAGHRPPGKAEHWKMHDKRLIPRCTSLIGGVATIERVI